MDLLEGDRRTHCVLGVNQKPRQVKNYVCCNSCAYSPQNAKLSSVFGDPQTITNGSRLACAVLLNASGWCPFHCRNSQEREAVMGFAVKRSLVAAGLMLVALLISPGVVFAQPPGGPPGRAFTAEPSRRTGGSGRDTARAGRHAGGAGPGVAGGGYCAAREHRRRGSDAGCGRYSVARRDSELKRRPGLPEITPRRRRGLRAMGFCRWD